MPKSCKKIAKNPKRGYLNFKVATKISAYFYINAEGCNPVARPGLWAPDKRQFQALFFVLHNNY